MFLFIYNSEQGFEFTFRTISQMTRKVQRFAQKKGSKFWNLEGFPWVFTKYSKGNSGRDQIWPLLAPQSCSVWSVTALTAAGTRSGPFLAPQSWSVLVCQRPNSGRGQIWPFLAPFGPFLAPFLESQKSVRSFWKRIVGVNSNPWLYRASHDFGNQHPFPASIFLSLVQCDTAYK